VWLAGRLMAVGLVAAPILVAAGALRVVAVVPDSLVAVPNPRAVPLVVAAT
jgi:hypothetical protein